MTFIANIKIEGRTDPVSHGYHLGTDRKVAEMFAGKIAECDYYRYDGAFHVVERVDLVDVTGVDLLAGETGEVVKTWRGVLLQEAV